jgi:hypothetical protein
MPKASKAEKNRENIRADTRDGSRVGTTEMSRVNTRDGNTVGIKAIIRGMAHQARNRDKM